MLVEVISQLTMELYIAKVLPYGRCWWQAWTSAMHITMRQARGEFCMSRKGVRLLNGKSRGGAASSGQRL